MKTKSLFRMIVAIVTVMLHSCISTSAYAKNYAGTYTFTDASKKTYTMVLKPGKDGVFYKGKVVFYQNGKIVDYASWESYGNDNEASVYLSDVTVLFPNGKKAVYYMKIKGAYLYIDNEAKNAEHPDRKSVV